MRQFFAPSFYILLISLLTVIGVKPIYGSSSCQDVYLTEQQKELKADFGFEDSNFARGLKFRLEEFMQAVVSEGRAGEVKLQLLVKLGFQKVDGAWVPPAFSEFYRRYVGLLDEMGVPENERILPAMAIGTWNGRSYQDHILFTPNVDPWPQTKKSASFIDGSSFNLPSEAVITALARGRYPLIPGMHDVFHYLTFIQFPEYAKTLRFVASQLQNKSNFVALEKFNFLNEVLALPNLKMKNTILASLLSTRGLPPRTHLSFAHFQNFFDALPEAQLLAYAEKMAITFPSYLKDFGGAIYNSHEKQGLLGMATDRLLDYSAPYFSDSYSERGLAYASPITFGASLMGLIQHLQKPLKPYHDSFDTTHESAKTAIRKRLASMEYFLWYFTTEKITPENFASQFVRPDGSTAPALQEALQNIWGPRSTFSDYIFPKP